MPSLFGALRLWNTVMRELAAYRLQVSRQVRMPLGPFKGHPCRILL